ncbi:pilin [Patescibacteria group bacterium]|nr:pilin [Patescibacteria group bacterium]
MEKLKNKACPVRNKKSRISVIFNAITLSFILITLSTPFLSQADLIPCKPYVDESGNMVNSCNFSSLVQLVDNIINFIITLSVSVSAIMFAYAGVLYLSGDPGKIKRAHEIFKNVALGLIFILGAWLIVKAILTGLGAEGTSLLNFK